LFTQALDSHRVVGNEEGLAGTYSQLGKTFLDSGHTVEAERCFNNASEHFIKLGNPAGEAAVLRELADLYEQRQDRVAAIRCTISRWEPDAHPLPPTENGSPDFGPPVAERTRVMVEFRVTRPANHASQGASWISARFAKWLRKTRKDSWVATA